MDHVSVIIVNHNSDQDTRQCLESVAAISHPGFTYQVIVVDNASKQLFQLPRHLAKEPITILRSESNLGFTGGNNLAIKHVIATYNSDYIVLLNNDTLVDKRFLLELYRHAQHHPQQGVISSKIYFAPGREYHAKDYKRDQRGNVLWYAGGSVDWQNLLAFHRGVDEVDRGHFDHQQTSDFASGCCMLIRREVLERVGVLDESYFLYFEDTDYSFRALEAGYDIGFCPASKVWHINAGSTGGPGSPLQQYYLERNRLWFTFQHGSRRSQLTAARLLMKMLVKGGRVERLAASDVLLRRMGKRVVV